MNRARSTLAMLALLALVLGVVAQRGLPRPQDTPASASPTVVATTAANGRTALLPLLQRAAEQAGSLVAMGDARERNLLRISAGQREMNAALAEVDAWLAAHPTEINDVSAVAAYREGAASIRSAMAEAQAGFLRLDFDRVARATELMREGEAALQSAIALLAR